MKASDVIGRQITVRDGGTVVGKIKDLVVDPSGREVMGLVLSDSMFSGTRVAPWRAVQAFGPDSVVIDTLKSVVKGSTIPEIQAVLDKKNRIKGLRLVTTKGKELGRIIDILFDESTGDVVGYELSGGLFSDTFDGTPFLPTPKWIELGKDAAFVDPEVESTVIPTGGIRSALRRGARQTVPEPPAGDAQVAAGSASETAAVPPADAAADPQAGAVSEPETATYPDPQTDTTASPEAGWDSGAPPASGPSASGQ